MRESAITSRYLPKNAMDCDGSWPNTRRYLPPVRTSISQESKDMPTDLGTHQRRNSSGLLQAWNTMCTGPSKIRVTTSSRSLLRSSLVSFSFLAANDLLLDFQFLDHIVQLIEASCPHLPIALDPGGFFLQPALAEPAGAHPADLLRNHQPRPLQDAHMLLHAREGHVELLGQVGDGGVAPHQLLQHPSPGGVGKRSKRSTGAILNHVVQYSTTGDL